MHIHLASSDVLEDSLVGCWCAAHIMMFRQAIHRNRYPDPRNAHPIAGNRNHGACDDHGMHFHVAEYRQEAAKLAMADQWLTSHQRQMQRTMDSYQPQNSIHQIVAPVVAQVPEID